MTSKKEELKKICGYEKCKSPFSTANKYKIYCCKRCQKRANYRPYKKIYFNVCENCRKEFVAKRKDNKYCSISCKERFRYVKNRDILLARRKIRYLQKEKPRYQQEKKRIKEVNYRNFQRIYQECEERTNDGIITDATITHKVFSYLNHHPDAKYGELFIEFPRLHEKQARFLYYFWTKITKEKYGLKITKEEKEHISNLFNKLINSPKIV